MADIAATIGLEPTETVAFFRAKGTYPQSRRWDDVWQEEHARAFTVAKIMDRQLLEQVRGSLDKVMSEGGTFEEWKASIQPQLEQAGWWGRVDREELTGVDYPVFVGDRRLRTIFDTNLRMARAAGQWQRIQDLKDVAPYLAYFAVDDSRTRPQHALWGGVEPKAQPIILPVDHPAWAIFYPPNGWHCRCNVIQLTDQDLIDNGWRISTNADLIARGWMTADGRVGGQTRAWRKSDGEIVQVPNGVDPGFAYNVGAKPLEGLAPPPATGPIAEPHVNVPDLPDLPEPRALPATTVLPKDTPASDAIDAFLREFDGMGPSAGGTTLATDVTGEPLVISDSFFYRGGVDSGDNAKLVAEDRIINARLYAEALKAPDEIWYVWEQTKDRDGNPGRWRLTRRYVARFEIDGKPVPVLVVVDVDPDGWKGVTAFRPRSERYLDKDQVRGGVLAYRRK